MELTKSIRPFQSTLPVSKAASIAAANDEFTERWKEDWATLLRKLRLALYNTAVPSKSITHMYDDLSWPQCSALMQLRTVSSSKNRCQRLQLILRLGTALLSIKLAAKSDHKLVLVYVCDTLRLPRYSL
ncbi:hypothetical protein C8R45DRAFT_1113905 [Mycena sanguinolenta]|nr:hypothetical protein C8R45DRAFT_1113905 [Mycena sanguinolenta]